MPKMMPKLIDLGLPPGAADALHDQVVIVPAGLEGGDHLGVAGRRREHAQFELRVIGVDQDTTFAGVEESAEFRIGRNILQVGIGAGVAPGDRAAGMQLTVKAPVDDVTGERPRRKS